MPSAEAMTRSIGVVMKPRTRSALAPTYTVVTVIAAFSLLGYCRTFSERTACSPAMRMTRLTTIATIGRRMKRSVKRMEVRPRSRLAVGRPRQLFSGRRERVVDEHGHAVLELEGSVADDLFSRLEARDHRDE